MFLIHTERDGVPHPDRQTCDASPKRDRFCFLLPSDATVRFGMRFDFVFGFYFSLSVDVEARDWCGCDLSGGVRSGGSAVNSLG